MRAREFIAEASKIPKSQISAVPGMNTHPNLDNSSPYAPWRFAAHFLAGADGKNPYEHIPEREGPSGQALVTVAFSSEEEAMIRQAEKAFGIEAKRLQLTPPGSTELDTIQKTSPVRAFKGYKR
jgi:hypothetical protein